MNLDSIMMVKRSDSHDDTLISFEHHLHLLHLFKALIQPLSPPTECLVYTNQKKESRVESISSLMEVMLVKRANVCAKQLSSCKTGVV